MVFTVLLVFGSLGALYLVVTARPISFFDD